MHKSLLVLLGCVWLGFGQEAPPPGCKALTYFGVTGCEPMLHGECLRGYHKQMACPTNPMMKAPCRTVCVVDSKPGDKTEPKPSPEAQVAGAGAFPHWD